VKRNEVRNVHRRTAQSPGKNRLSLNSSKRKKFADPQKTKTTVEKKKKGTREPFASFRPTTLTHNPNALIGGSTGKQSGFRLLEEKASWKKKGRKRRLASTKDETRTFVREEGNIHAEKGMGPFTRQKKKGGEHGKKKAKEEVRADRTPDKT